MLNREEIVQKQKELDILFSAWIAEKKKHEVLTFQQKNGQIIEHYPDGAVKVIKNAIS